MIRERTTTALTFQDWPDEHCPHCNGDGNLYTCVSTWDRHERQWFPDWRDADPCPRCDGTGWVLK